jgi:uncharacterized protein YggE
MHNQADGQIDGRRQGSRASRAVGALALVLLIGVVAAACGSSPPVNVSAPQGTSVNGVDDGLTVTGTGEVDGTPDTLTASFGILVRQPSVSMAISTAANTSKQVVATLQAHGIAAKDIQTQNYSVAQAYDTVGTRSIPNGFFVGETLVVAMHQVATAGATIDAVSAAGGPAVSVQNIAFSLDNNQALLARARAKAYADAKAQAQQLSSLSGHHLGPTEGIDLTVNTTPYYATQRSAALSLPASAGTTQFQPGQLTTTVQLTVRFALQ